MARHGKMRSFDSETTSLGLSPPQSPPRHPVYFVQSPSRDSEYKPSFQSTPALSPSASPLHHSFASRHSVDDNASTVSSASTRYGSRKILPHPSSDRKKKGGLSSYKPWNPGTIHEDDEGLPDGESLKNKKLSRWCMCGLSCLCCLLVFSVVMLIFWLVSHPHAPKLLVKDIVFSEFLVVDGAEDGVPTRVLTANCTLKLQFINPSKYFGLHVGSSDVVMEYEALSVGKGQVHKFYQAKDSKRTFSVGVEAVKVPLYGAGPNLQSLTQAGGGVPLHLKANIKSRAYVFWKLAKPKFRSYFSCSVTVNSSGKNFLKLLYRTCTYQAPKG